MLPQSLQLPLGAALNRSFQGREGTVEYSGLRIREAGYDNLIVSLEVSQQIANRKTGEFFLVTIAQEDLPALDTISNQFEADADTTQYVLQLERELQRTRESLQATIEELETTNEEQQATNEELIASNEELQSTNEELQSVNEELYTVNAEYQSKIQQLTELNNDLDNLLRNIDIGVIFLDNELSIRKFTPAATLICNLVKTDISRPLAHLSHNLENLDLESLLEQSQKQDTIEREVRIKGQGSYFLMRIHPYLTESQTVDGVVLTFVNIDDIKRTQLRLEAAEVKLNKVNENLEQEVRRRTADLENSQYLLKSINQSTPNNIYIYDLLEKRNVYTNRSIEEILGYTQEDLEAMGNEINTYLFHPEDLEKVAVHHQNIIDTAIADDYDCGCKEIFSLEYRVRDVSGNWHWIYSQDIIFKCSEDGTPTQILGTAIDISARKAIEMRLKRSQERYELIAKVACVGMWEWDAREEKEYRSPLYKQILGYDEDELEGDADVWKALLHPDDYDRVTVAQESHLKSRAPYNLEYRLRTKCEGYLWVQGIGQAIWDEAGNPIRMAGAIIDINNRKLTQERLQESEARYRSLYHNTPVMLHSISNTGELLSVSDLWLTTFGYERDEVIGRKSTEFLTPESRQYARDIVLPNYFKTGKCFDIPYQWICRDGSIRDVLLSATSEQDASGTVIRSLAVLIDVTEQNKTQKQLKIYQERLEELVESRAAEIKQTNQQLQVEILEREQAQCELLKRAQLLEQSNQDLEQFAYVISHDLQEPLRSMSIFAQLLEGEYGELLDANAIDYIQNIVEGGIRMHELINGILAFSRITHHNFASTEVDFQKIIMIAIKNLTPIIKETQTIITHDDLPTNLYASKNHMIQLFQNLFSNAIKFRSASPPHIHIMVEQELNGWCFGVRDNGIGIGQDEQDRLFGLFQRLHTRDEKEGYGIGLAICKKIVERHRGHIWVKSEPGKGSTFYFTIPLVQDTGENDAATSQDH